MARPNPKLIIALRATAARLRDGATFKWTHMGACICGNLAQVVTQHSRAEIHRLALQKAGDWGQQAIDHCPTSGYPFDHILDRLVELGLDHEDIQRLERLDDHRVLGRFPVGDRDFDHRDRADVVRYLEAFADFLDEEAAVQMDRRVA